MATQGIDPADPGCIDPTSDELRELVREKLASFAQSTAFVRTGGGADPESSDNPGSTASSEARAPAADTASVEPESEAETQPQIHLGGSKHLKPAPLSVSRRSRALDLTLDRAEDATGRISAPPPPPGDQETAVDFPLDLPPADPTSSTEPAAPEETPSQPLSAADSSSPSHRGTRAKTAAWHIDQLQKTPAADQGPVDLPESAPQNPTPRSEEIPTSPASTPFANLQNLLARREEVIEESNPFDEPRVHSRGDATKRSSIEPAAEADSDSDSDSAPTRETHPRKELRPSSQTEESSARRIAALLSDADVAPTGTVRSLEEPVPEPELETEAPLEVPSRRWSNLLWLPLFAMLGTGLYLGRERFGPGPSSNPIDPAPAPSHEVSPETVDPSSGIHPFESSPPPAADALVPAPEQRDGRLSPPLPGGLNDAAEISLRGFAEASDVATKLLYAFPLEDLPIRMKMHYLDRPSAASEISTLVLSRSFGDPDTGERRFLFDVTTTLRDDPFPVVVSEHEGSFLVDWEGWIQAEERLFEAFADLPQRGLRQFRVHLQETAQPESGESGTFPLPALQAVRAIPMASARTIELVYPAESIPEMEAFLGPNPSPAIVAVEWVDPEGDRPHLRLDRIVVQGWHRPLPLVEESAGEPSSTDLGESE